MDFKWRNPPTNARRRASSDYDEVAQKLVNRPGAWAQIQIIQPNGTGQTKPGQRASTQASMIRHGRIKAFDTEGLAGQFEARAVTETLDGKPVGVVYARYVPTR